LIDGEFDVLRQLVEDDDEVIRKFISSELSDWHNAALQNRCSF